MISGLHIGTELRRFKRFKLSRVAIIAICILPILYSTLYLWSFWNPFGEINRVPVALVNSDQGAMVDGQVMNAGAQVTQGLLDDKSLDWQKVSHQEAIDGVQNGRFYFALELPEDFSAAVASPGQKDPQPEKATLQATYNDANGYLSTVIGENAMRAVLNVVDERIGAQAVDKLLVGLLDAGTGISRAADGSTELKNGLRQLVDGGNRLSDGMRQAVDGTDRLSNGTGQLRDGSGQLKDGSAQLAGGLDQLADGVNSASGTIDEVGAQADQLEAQIDQAGSQVAQVSRDITAVQQAAQATSDAQGRTAADLRAIANSLRIAPDPGSQDAARRLDDLANQMDNEGLGPNSQTMRGINGIAATAQDADRQVNDPNSQLRGAFRQVDEGIAKFGELQDGVARLQDGAHRLNDGLIRLNDGAIRLDDGAKELHDGSLRLSDGANQLRDGIVRAHDGSAQLSEGLRAGTEQMPAWSPTQREGIASVMGGPVKVSDYHDTGSHTFGGGLAPFFFSIALYIGAIMMFFLIKPLQRRAVASGISPLRAAIDGFLSPGVVGLGQALAVVGLTLLAVPLETSTKLGLFGFAMLVSLMNVALIQMFNSILPPGPGRVTAMAFLMIQLVSSGGLYPIETEPMPLQWIHPFMPMTYAVNGFRQILYGSYDSRLPIAIAAVVFFTILAILITSLAAARDRTWTMKRLHPAIQI